MKVTEKDEIAGRGHQKARAQEVHVVHSGTMTKIKVRREEISISKARQEKMVNLRSVSFTQGDTADQVRIVPFSTSAKMTSRRTTTKYW